METNFQTLRLLGRTGLTVGRLGLAASYGAPASAYERGFDQGCNLFYWGSVRRAGMAEAIHRLAGQHRDRLVVVLESYSRLGLLMQRNIESGLRRLRLNHADILLLGWHNTVPFPRLMDAAQRLRERGLVRHLAVSAHHRPVFQQLACDPRLEVLMVRYNASHRHAEQIVFPHLGDQRPGVITYTATRWRTLIEPHHTPPGLRTPTAVDCYRFVLSQPAVDVCLTGPATTEEMVLNLKALELGPLSAEELEWMRTVGDHVHRRTAHSLGNPFMERDQ